MVYIILGGKHEKNYRRLKAKQTGTYTDKLGNRAIKKLDPSFDFEVKEIVTKGDRILDVTLSKVGEKDYL